MPCVVLLMLLTLAALPPAGAAPLRFAPVPLEEQSVMQEQFRGLLDYLAERLEEQVELVRHEDYGELLGAFRDGAVDLAYLGPLPYVLLKRMHPAAEPLGCFRDADGAAAYTCALVADADAGLTPADVHDLRIGLTQPYSTCGYLAVAEILLGAGHRLDGDGNGYAFAGSHSEAALGVVRGEYDLAGVKTSIAHRYAHLNLDVIGESRAYPGFALVANTATLGADRLQRLRDAVLALDPARRPGVAAVTAGWGDLLRHGVASPAACDYSGIETVLKQLPAAVPMPETGS